jgi:urease accessory protein
VSVRGDRPWAAALRATVLLALLPRAAIAHGFVGDGGPAAGFMHPLTGPDHLLAMYAVGLLSAQIGGRAIWTVPGAFVLVMVAGGILGAATGPLALTELGVAVSVVALGAAVAVGGRAPVWIALAAAGCFGFFHGHAHGVEMPAASSPPLYALGFAVSTIGLHVLGALTGLLVLCRRRGRGRLRWTGVCIALAGAVLVTTAARERSPAHPAPATPGASPSGMRR